MVEIVDVFGPRDDRLLRLQVLRLGARQLLRDALLGGNLALEGSEAERTSGISWLS